MISRRQFSAVGLASLAALFTAHKAVAELAATTSLRRRGTFAVERLDRIVLVADDIDRLARFYAAIGFVVDDARPAPLHAQLAHARTATSRTMRVGNDTIELVAFDPPGNPLPRPVRIYRSLVSAHLPHRTRHAGGHDAASRNGRLDPNQSRWAR